MSPCWCNVAFGRIGVLKLSRKIIGVGVTQIQPTEDVQQQALKEQSQDMFITALTSNMSRYIVHKNKRKEQDGKCITEPIFYIT